MSGSQIGAVAGAVVGGIVGGPAGARWGWMIGSALGGIVAPTKTFGPKLSDAQRPTAGEGVPIPFGYGTYPVSGQLIWAGAIVEHEVEEGGKGGGQQAVNYTYTRPSAIAFGKGEATGIAQLKRNGKIVYDITDTSTIQGQNAKFLAGCTIYLGTETQLVDPTIEAAVGVGNTSPYRGTIYIVLEDDTTQQGEVAQWEAVVQKCGTVTSINDTSTRFLAAGFVGAVEESQIGASWPNIGTGLAGVTLRFLARRGDIVCASSYTGQMWRSLDRGASWVQSTTVTNYSVTDIVQHNGRWVAVTDGSIIISLDDGDTWVEHPPAMTIVGISKLAAGGPAGFVLAVGSVGFTRGRIYTSTTGTNWVEVLNFDAMCVTWNGTHYMVAGDRGTCYASPTGGSGTWVYGSQPGGLQWSANCLEGGPGYFLMGTNNGLGTLGVYKSVDLGVTWVHKGSGGTIHQGASGNGYHAFLQSGGSMYSVNEGETFTFASCNSTVDVVYMGPEETWLEIPDAPGAWTDEEGEVRFEYTVGTQISSCGADLGDIVADLCGQSGIASTEYDVTDLAGVFVKGFKCAAGSGADAYIEALAQAHFFDRGEWDKKLRFVMRGGASVGALTTDDLVRLAGPSIVTTEVQEYELLRKVSVLTLNPATNYTMGKQSWERRVSTVQARGESTIELPLVAFTDTTAQIAAIKGKIAWTETEKRKFALSLRNSKYTPTDIVTLTDHSGAVHRIRLTTTFEEGNIFTIEEAVKDRAAVYASNAVGTIPATPPTTTPGLVGATLFAAFNLPVLRSSDNTPGIYVGACGMLDGWTGCQILMSVDGGLSYQVALTITEPTTMGNLTADCTTSSEPIAVRVFGGTLENKTAAQVDLGANWAAIETDGVAEIIAYTTATATTAIRYNLTGLYRGRDETDEAPHVIGNQFMLLSTARFLPVSQSYAGMTLYFKAVGFGVSADAVTAVPIVFGGRDFIVDAGEVVGPLGLLDRAGAVIYDRAGQAINTRV